MGAEVEGVMNTPVAEHSFKDNSDCNWCLRHGRICSVEEMVLIVIEVVLLSLVCVAQMLCYGSDDVMDFVFLGPFAVRKTN